MKICKNVQIYGIEKIIFDKTTEYELAGKEMQYPGEWRRVNSKRGTGMVTIEHQKMSKNISAICNTKEYEVGFNGNTAHVTTIAKKRAEKRVMPKVVFICGCARHGE